MSTSLHTGDETVRFLHRDSCARERGRLEGRKEVDKELRNGSERGKVP